MIGSLRGTISHVGDGSILIDVQGVGYELSVTHTLKDLAVVGDELGVIVYTDVRENAITLYGFHDRSEREVFLLLKKVKGVGSRIAIAMVSQMGAATILQAIATEDTSLIRRCPGVGKKTAERILVELRESVIALTDISPDSLSDRIVISRASPKRRFESTPLVDDTLLALERLGITGDKAERAVHSALESNSARVWSDAGELLKEALVHLT